MNREWIPEHQIWSIFCQITLGLHYCHTGGMALPLLSEETPVSTTQLNRIVIHRDIKPENSASHSTSYLTLVLIGHNNVIKISDFGLAKRFSPQEKFAVSKLGTVPYMAPEVLSERPYTSASDIWSLGCVIYELAALARPFQGNTSGAVTHNIQARQCSGDAD